MKKLFLLVTILLLILNLVQSPAPSIPPNCKTGAAGVCTKCKWPYRLITPYCYPSRCTHVATTGAEIGLCDTCETYFFLNPTTHLCVAYPPNCKTVNAATGVCTECNPNFKLNPTTKKCYPLCIRYYFRKCVKCITGYYPVAGICVAVAP